jgi:hypothetical protein
LRLRQRPATFARARLAGREAARVWIAVSLASTRPASSYSVLGREVIDI